MVDSKPFKTKLCVLFERGLCARHSCTFAHGLSQLRRPRPYRDIDLRRKLNRKRSPLVREVQGSTFAPSLPTKTRKLRAHEHTDGAIDSSSGFRSPDGTEYSTKDKKHASSYSRTMLDDELKQVQYEIDMLLSQNSQLEIELEQRLQEADILSSRIRDLEAHLVEEKDNSKRVNSRIKKFIRAHVHHSRLQDEIKRSQVQLDQLVGKLDVTAVPISEDKLNINIISDEVLGLEDSTSPVRKQLYSSRENPEGPKSDYRASGNVAVVGSWRNSLVHLDNHQETVTLDKRNDIARQSSKNKSRRWNNTSKIFDPLDKNTIEMNNVVPPTSMAAHALDDFVELVEEEENHSTSVEKVLPLLRPPPLPSVSQNTYLKYKGGDENVNVDVDVDGHEEDFEEVDIV